MTGLAPVCHLNSGKGNARDILEAFARGCGGTVTTVLEPIRGRPAVFWGVDPVTLPLWQAVTELRHPFIYVDNEYIRGRDGVKRYRVTLGGTQHSGLGASDGVRWRTLGLSLESWHSDGRHVLIACHTDWWHKRHGYGSAEGFARMAVGELARHTDRTVMIRQKPIHGRKEPPLSEQLKDCWAVVTHGSMVAAEALLAGVPAFALAGRAFETVAKRKLSEIEDPLRVDDRERWASVLADNQWTLAEIRDGTCWRSLGADA